MRTHHATLQRCNDLRQQLERTYWLAFPRNLPAASSSSSSSAPPPVPNPEQELGLRQLMVTGQLDCYLLCDVTVDAHIGVYCVPYVLTEYF